MCHFEGVHEQNTVDRGVGERQFELVHQCREPRPRRGPFHHALRRRHEGKAALGLLAELAEIRRGIAHPEHAHTARVGKTHADAAPDETPRRYSEPLGVEIAQIDHIDGHAPEYHVVAGLGPLRAPGTSR